MLALLLVDTGIFVVDVECDGMREVEYFDGGWILVRNQILKSTVSMGRAAFSVRNHQQLNRFVFQQLIQIGGLVCCV